MSAGYQDLFLEQGTTFSTQLTLNDVYGNPYNLTSYRIASQARRSYYSANATITFATSISNANTGTITLGLDSANSANVPTGTLLYDVIIKDSSNNVTRVLEGRVFVDPMITRPTF
jgi:hypothetical protein